MSTPQLPQHNPGDPVESAVIGKLAESWGQRATVKRPEPDLDELFEPDAADYPEALIPFSRDDRFAALDGKTQNRIRAWAWIAYNKSVIDIEQYVVNPGFRMLARDGFDGDLGDTRRIAVMQAMVDEEYHTLMHLNVSALTRRRRGWALHDNLLPQIRTVRAQDADVAAATSPRHAALTKLAYMTVAETSISAYLALMTTDASIQPVNRATVALHRRDELCHSSIAGELLKDVYARLGPDDRHDLVRALAAGLDAFTGSDYLTWTAILRAEGVAEADQIIHDVEAESHGQRVVQDCTAIHRLCHELGIEAELDRTRS